MPLPITTLLKAGSFHIFLLPRDFTSIRAILVDYHSPTAPLEHVVKHQFKPGLNKFLEEFFRKTQFYIAR